MKDFIMKVLKLLYRNVDKLLHYLITYFVVITCYMFNIPIAIAVLCALILSILKELLDKYLYNGFSIGDLIADILGIISALALLYWRI